MQPTRSTLRTTAGVIVTLVIVGLLAATLPAAALAASPPVIESESASHITDTDATLEAQINSGGLDTSYEFYLEYPSCFSDGPGFCEATGGTEIASGTVPAGSSTQTVSEDVAAVIGHSLLPDTTYGYRVVASNTAGIRYSGLRAFTTLPGKPPVIESVSVSHLTSTDATLEARIDTEGLSTSYEFQMWSSPCSRHGAGCELLIDIPLPSGLLLGSFVPQNVSLDLNSASVTLDGGEYGFSVTATSAAGSTSVGGGTFEPPVSVEPIGVPDPPLDPGVTPGPVSEEPTVPIGEDSSTSTGGGQLVAGTSSSTPATAPGPGTDPVDLAQNADRRGISKHKTRKHERRRKPGKKTRKRKHRKA